MRFIDDPRILTPRSLAENILNDIYFKEKDKKKGTGVAPGKSKKDVYVPSKENTKRVMKMFDEQKN
jgi:hypothetical protein